MIRLTPGLRRGAMSVPVSKSHAHRVLIAEFLSGRVACLAPAGDDCDDIVATKRCLAALDARLAPRARDTDAPRARDVGAASLALDCGESGTTRRLLGPVVAALGVRPQWIMRGRLAARPQIDYARLDPGVQVLSGDVSSQFVSGLLFALPLLDGDSEIRLTSPLASRGYVGMTLDVLRVYGVFVEETATGFRVPGRQRFVAPADGPRIETDWSGAAFPLAMNALGNDVCLTDACAAGLSADSRQPDRAVVAALADFVRGGEKVVGIDVCPDLFPVLSVVAARRNGTTRFVGIRRLRLKESDRVAAMADVLTRFGVETSVTEGEFAVFGRPLPFCGGAFRSYADHRIAMSIGVGATVADGEVEIDDERCAAKSYPGFFEQFSALGRLSVS